MKRVSLLGLVLVFGSITSTRAIADTLLSGRCTTPNALRIRPVALGPPPRFKLSAPTGDTVVTGSVVTIYFDDDKDDTETFLLGSREISSTTDLTVYSPESALGKSILGARAGDTVTYTAPTGKDIKVTVITFAPFTG